MTTPVSIELNVNGKRVSAAVEPRVSLADFLREKLRLTGTHLGCEHGVCGACTVIVDGVSARACLMFAVQAHGANVTTVEGLAPEGELTDLQQAFQTHHALQCGFCTPGLLTTAHVLLQENPNPTADQVREAVSGNICRCTGYVGIVEAILATAQARILSSKPKGKKT
jgi:carbon-monoxide dehydrogenase small subunit